MPRLNSPTHATIVYNLAELVAVLVERAAEDSSAIADELAPAQRRGSGDRRMEPR